MYLSNNPNGKQICVQWYTKINRWPFIRCIVFATNKKYGLQNLFSFNWLVFKLSWKIMWFAVGQQMTTLLSLLHSNTFMYMCAACIRLLRSTILFIVYMLDEMKALIPSQLRKCIAYRPFISSVGQSVNPHGISVVPTIRPNMNPNNTDRDMPVAKAIAPDRWIHPYWEKSFIKETYSRWCE